jgi:hypothetical protein
MTSDFIPACHKILKKPNRISIILEAIITKKGTVEIEKRD